MDSPALTARTLAEALPYLRAYHGKVIVVRFGGQAMAEPDLKARFASDVALLRLVGMQPIVVHGGGWRIDDLMLKMGMKPQRHAGFRVTDEHALTVVEMALDELNQELTGLVNQAGGKAVGLNGQDGRFIRARAMRVDDASVELGHVGDVDSVDVELLRLLMSREFVPVIMPLGVGADGTAYHINSDRLAGAIARALGAEKLVLMTNGPGLVDRAGRTAWVVTAREVEQMVSEGSVPPERQARVAAAVDAVRHGVRSVHIIDGGVPSALMLEVLTADGAGTAIRSDEGPHFIEDARSYFFGDAAAP